MRLNDYREIMKYLKLMFTDFASCIQETHFHPDFAKTEFKY